VGWVAASVDLLWRMALAGRDKGAKPLQAAQPRLRAKRAPKKIGPFGERGDAATPLKLRASLFCVLPSAKSERLLRIVPFPSLSPLFFFSSPPLSLPFSSGAVLGGGSVWWALRRACFYILAPSCHGPRPGFGARLGGHLPRFGGTGRPYAPPSGSYWVPIHPGPAKLKSPVHQISKSR
jgi:hypothetical protein